MQQFTCGKSFLTLYGVELFIFEELYMDHSQLSSFDITKTSPCNEDPLTPHFYIVKLGFTGVYIFSYFCSKT